MSAVLGHIHFWLYKKIQLIAEREQIIKKEEFNLLLSESYKNPSLGVTSKRLANSFNSWSVISCLIMPPWAPTWL